MGFQVTDNTRPLTRDVSHLSSLPKRMASLVFAFACVVCFVLFLEGKVWRIKGPLNHLSNGSMWVTPCPYVPMATVVS